MSEHFNGLTPAQAERLACLAEECGEVVQAVGKILRHGYESTNPVANNDVTNRAMLQRECADVIATLDLMVSARDINQFVMQTFRERKHESRKPYFHHQEHHKIKPSP